MPTCATDLSTRSNQVELAAAAVVAGNQAANVILKLADVLTAEARQASWRLVEILSLDGRPCEVELAWTAGSGGGGSAKVTVSRATRVSVFARSLRVRVANLSTGGTNRVVVNVADGFSETRNVWELRGAGDVNPIVVEVPPFADRVRLDLGNANDQAAALVIVSDGNNVPRSTTFAADQPPDGIILGSAGRVQILAGSAWRLVYTLKL